MNSTSFLNLDNTVVIKSFGRYTLPSGWHELKDLSKEQKRFYVKKRIATKGFFTNISVESGDNLYSVEEHGDFRQAILRQLSIQLRTFNKQDKNQSVLTGSGFNSKKGKMVFKFVMEIDDSLVTQYYIVGEYRHCLVHVTNFLDPRIPDVDMVAQSIVDSFEWLAVTTKEKQ